MFSTKIFANAVCELVKAQENKTSTLTNEEFSEKLILYSEGKLPPCKNCKKREKCHKPV